MNFDKEIWFNFGGVLTRKFPAMKMVVVVGGRAVRAVQMQ
jgi:hypothetical protein